MDMMDMTVGYDSGMGVAVENVTADGSCQVADNKSES